MAATPIPALNDNQALVTPAGRPTVYGDAFLRGVYNRLGGTKDKIAQALAVATAAVPQTTQVAAGGGLQGGGTLSGNVAVTLYAAKTVVASLPTAGVSEGDWAYALNGRKPGEGAGAGTGVPVFRSAGAWYAVTSGAVVTS